MHRADWKPLLEATTEHALRYLEGLPERPVSPLVTAGEMIERLGGPLPARGADPEEVIEILARVADPGLLATAGGRFFGFVIGGALPASVAADWLVSAWDQNTAVAAVTPATVAIDTIAADWLLDVLDLPRDACVGFTTGCQLAHVVCLAAARDAVLRAVGWDVESHGLQDAPRITIVGGEEWHHTVPRALRFLGLGAETATLVASDDQGRLRPDALADAIAPVQGPLIVIAQAGNLHSGAIDPIDAIADVVDDWRDGDGNRPAWLHVDGAFGLWARSSPAHRHHTAGMERADSWATDAHKWLNVPYDCGVAICADTDAHVRAVNLHAEYLPEEQRGAVRDAMDRNLEMSRRARSVPVWAALRQLGRQGVVGLTDRLIAHARRFADGLAAVEGVAILNEVVTDQVLVRFEDDDELTADVCAEVQRQGECWVGPSTWRGQVVLRVSVSSWATDEHDVDRSVTAILRAYRTVRAA